MGAQNEIRDKQHSQSVDLSEDLAECKVSAANNCLPERSEPNYGVHFRQMFENSPFGVALVNEDHELLAVNPHLRRILQYPGDDLARLTLFDIIHPDDIADDIAHARNLFAGEMASYTMELRCMTKDGQLLWLKLTGSQLRDVQTGTLYALLMLQEIPERTQAGEENRQLGDESQEGNGKGTARLKKINETLVTEIARVKKAEKALLESNERLRSIVDTAKDSIIGTDSLGNVIMWNSAAARAFGYSAEEILNRPVTLLMPDRFIELHRSAHSKAATSERLHAVRHMREVAGLRKDGTEFPIEMSVSGWKTQQGVFFTGIIRDITQRKRKDEELRKAYEELESRVIERTAELVKVNANLKEEIAERKRIDEMLRDSERLYHTLVEEVPDAIFVLDSDGRFTYLNSQAEEFLKRPVPEILGTPLSAYVAPEERERIESIRALHRDDICDEEMRFLDADGAEKFARIRCKRLENAEKGEVQYEGVMRDITQRRRLEEQLKESRKELLEKIQIIDELYAHIVESGKAKAIAEHTAEVAHELRQPLTIIGGFAQRIARQIDLCLCNVKKNEGQAEAVRAISSEIRRLEKILDTLIDFTRRESVKQQLTDPGAIIKNVINVYKDILEEQDLKVELTFRGKVGEVPLDPGRFEQVVRNLITNAIDASPSGETIYVETGFAIPSSKALETAELESARYFEMRIRNHGPMIQQEDLQKLFRPFHTTKSYGTGVGLTVSKKIVEAHNGSISVHSDPDGTTFTVWIPLTEPETAVKSLNP